MGVMSFSLIRLWARKGHWGIVLSVDQSGEPRIFKNAYVEEGSRQRVSSPLTWVGGIPSCSLPPTEEGRASFQEELSAGRKQ